MAVGEHEFSKEGETMLLIIACQLGVSRNVELSC